MPGLNGHHLNGSRTLHDEEMSTSTSPTSYLNRAADDEVHDIVCVGFGPASLSIAIALHDAIESNDAGLKTLTPKVRFIERQPEYAWHPGMLLDDSDMQISFMKDLATLRNPRSKFTFVSYLHEQKRLVDFTNLGVLLPKRLEYNDYMQWCARAFDDVVDYDKSVTRIEAVSSESATAAVQHFRIVSKCNKTGKEQMVEAKHVVIAVGGKPFFPKPLDTRHPQIIHSSQYVTHAASLFPAGSPPRRIAVVGAGQSAAEIFNDIPCRFPGAQSVLITRGASLRPSDDSPFVNELFNPSRTDDVFSQSPEIRAQTIASNRSTNYGVVRLNLLEHIYSSLYSCKVKHLPEELWPRRLLTHSTVTGVEPDSADGRTTLQLQISSNANAHRHQQAPVQQSLEVDLVIVACGYERNSHNQFMQDLEPLRPEADAAGWTIGRNYGVNFSEGALESDRGVWLQGCNEKTHGLPDSLLSILSVRGGEMVNNILGTPGRALKLRR